MVRFGRAAGVFDAGVNVLGILAKDHHLHFFRMLHWRRHTGEILHRPQANVEIQHLAQRDVERANAPADRRRQWSFDADQKFLERFDGVIRQPVIEFVFGCLAREHFEPGDFLFPAVSFLDGRIKHSFACAPDVRSCAVAANERQNRMVRHIELAALNRNFYAGGRRHVFVSHVVRFR